VTSYVQPRSRTMAPNTIKIIKTQTKLTAIRSARLNLHLRPIQASLCQCDFINSLPDITHVKAANTVALPAQLAFSASRALTQCRNRVIALRNSSTCRYADNKKDQTYHQEEEEQQFRNPCRRSGNARESEKRRHQCDYKKNQSPTQHPITSSEAIALLSYGARFFI